MFANCKRSEWIYNKAITIIIDTLWLAQVFYRIVGRAFLKGSVSKDQLWKYV